jgi:hypothetical protein
MIPRLPHGFSHPMRIGSGAFASVYRAQQTALDRRVALKFIYEKNSAKRRDLLKEAQTQANLDADCVPQIFDAFEWHGCVCMVMEWIHGVSLTSLLESSPLSANDRMSLADCFIHALAEIHKRGYAHRDLKPENILLSPDNGLFLVDFGFSKNIADATVSSINTAKGTPAYMAPELWSGGGKTDLMRADVFAAGKILLQVLDGTSAAGFAAPCTNVNPLQRPASGTELLALWEASALSTVERTWQKLAGDIAAAELSVHLLAAAKQLLYAHRSDEAYWLLVESLEVDGNNLEAIELLGSFQERTGKGKKVVRYAVFAAILCTGVVLAFFAGLQSRQSAMADRASFNHIGSSHLLVANRYGSLPGKASLRHDSLKTDKLCGTLLVRNVPKGGFVLIDTDTVNSDTVVHKGVFVSSGSHDIVIYDSMQLMVKRETVELLPFQIATVDAAVYRFSGKEQR